MVERAAWLCQHLACKPGAGREAHPRQRTPGGLGAALLLGWGRQWSSAPHRCAAGAMQGRPRCSRERGLSRATRLGIVAAVATGPDTRRSGCRLWTWGGVPPGDRVPGEMRPAARSRPRLPAAHRPSAPLVPRPAARPRLVIGHTSRQAAPALAKELQVARPGLVNVRAAPAPAPGRGARLAGAGTVSSQAGPGRCGRGLGWRQR